jgi:hypothetical protein
VGAPPPFLASLQALWEAPLDEVAATLLYAVAAPKLDADPYPTLTEGAFDQIVLDTLPETRTRGFIAMGPEFATARQIIREAIALLEVNLLVTRIYTSTGSNGVTLTRRGHAAIRSGDVRLHFKTVR